VRIFYDTEFIDDGKTIDLISIGLVADDGREYYAVNSQFSMDKLARNQWLVDNVFPGLPWLYGDARMAAITFARPDWAVSRKRRLEAVFNRAAPAVKPRAVIAREVGAFITATDDPQLWDGQAARRHPDVHQRPAAGGRPARQPARARADGRQPQRARRCAPQQAHRGVPRRNRGRWMTEKSLSEARLGEIQGRADNLCRCDDEFCIAEMNQLADEDVPDLINEIRRLRTTGEQAPEPPSRGTSG
jgi:hypothetical protein